MQYPWADGRPEQALVRKDDLERDLLMRQRLRVHLGVRAGVRLFQLLSPTHGGGGRSWRIPLAIAADTTAAWWMAAREPIGKWRVLLDCTEVGITTLCAPDAVDAARMAFMPSLNLCMEAGIEGGATAVVIPAALSATALMVRRASGRRVLAGQVGWPIGASLAGVLYRTHLHNHRHRLARSNDAHMAAISSQAFRAGQLHEATRADSVVDEVQHALVLVEDDGGPRIRQAMASWKASLVDAVRDEATYLSELLLRWESLRNLDADLSLAVRFDFPADNLVLLSGSQGAELWRVLDCLPLAGLVDVQIVDRPLRLPGQPLELVVGGHPVVIAADQRAGYQSGLTTVAAGLAAVLLIQQSQDHFGSVLSVPTVFGVSAFAALGVWSDRHLPSSGARGRRFVALAASAISAVYTVAASPGVPAVRSSGGTAAAIPAIAAVQGAAALYGTVSPGLTRLQRQLALGSMAGTVAIGWLLLPRRVPLREVLVELAWPAAVLLAMTNLASIIDAATNEMASELASQREPVAAASFERGRRWVRSFCAEFVAAAAERVDLHSTRQDGGVAVEARRRIAALRLRLEDTTVAP